MSLLWVTAMPWWNGEAEEHEEDLRPEGETLKQRGQRYKQMVVDNHGVRPEVAQKAVKRVIKHLDGDSIWRDPTEYGFARPRATIPAQLLDTPEGAQKIYRSEIWNAKKVESVPLDQEPIHATQTHVKHTSVAHNLFHPGKKQPSEEVHQGDPDYNPAHDVDDDGDWGLTPERKQRVMQELEATKHPRFLKTNDGSLHLIDGHHRVATDMLLGKRQTYGRVVHQSELEGPGHEHEDQSTPEYMERWLQENR